MVLLETQREFRNTRFFNGERIVIRMELMELESWDGPQFFSTDSVGEEGNSHTGGHISSRSEMLRELWPDFEFAASLSHCNERGVPVRCMQLSEHYIKGSDHTRLSYLFRITFNDAMMLSDKVRKFKGEEFTIELAKEIDSLRSYWKSQADMVKTFMRTNGETYMT
jgi:hypothetical protein